MGRSLVDGAQQTGETLSTDGWSAPTSTCIEPSGPTALSFFVRCVPPTTTHHRKRIVRAGRFTRMADAPELNAAKAMLDELLLPHQPAMPLAGAVRLSLTFVWPWRKSESKRRRALLSAPHTSRPDCSNLAKTLEDRLVALRFLEDDNAVAVLGVRKFWGNQPGITVDIEAL